VNGGHDFDDEMLDEVYVAIKYVCFIFTYCSFQFMKSLVVQNYTSAVVKTKLVE